MSEKQNQESLSFVEIEERDFIEAISEIVTQNQSITTVELALTQNFIKFTPKEKTDAEAIEVKGVDNWFEALCQVLAYAAYLWHGKRIHLFGRANLPKLLLAQATDSAIASLVAKGYLDEKVFGLSRSDLEYQICDRLKHELKGQVEVITAVGRIDLLTETEVIEIKEISDWEEALGKVLAYSAFFPEYSKRIHLFGKPDLTKLALAQATCSEFGVAVTFEEVKGEY